MSAIVLSVMTPSMMMSGVCEPVIVVGPRSMIWDASPGLPLLLWTFTPATLP